MSRGAVVVAAVVAVAGDELAEEGVAGGADPGGAEAACPNKNSAPRSCPSMLISYYGKCRGSLRMGRAGRTPHTRDAAMGSTDREGEQIPANQDREEPVHPYHHSGAPRLHCDYREEAGETLDRQQPWQVAVRYAD